LRRTPVAVHILALKCLVVMPEKTLVDEWVDFVALPLYDGEVGILAAHP
jgi:F0F1-type ATP synthase epsilon subunit